MPEESAYEDLLKRLTVLIVKLDEHYDVLVASLSEQKEFNRQQIAMNGRLETLVTRMLRQEGNGRDA